MDGRVVKVSISVTGVGSVSGNLEYQRSECARDADGGDPPVVDGQACVNSAKQSLGAAFDAHHGSTAQLLPDPWSSVISHEHVDRVDRAGNQVYAGVAADEPVRCVIARIDRIDQPPVAELMSTVGRSGTELSQNLVQKVQRDPAFTNVEGFGLVEGCKHRPAFDHYAYGGQIHRRSSQREWTVGRFNQGVTASGHVEVAGSDVAVYSVCASQAERARTADGVNDLAAQVFGGFGVTVVATDIGTIAGAAHQLDGTQFP